MAKYNADSIETMVPVGPIAPLVDKAMIYALDAEESSMIQPVEKLTDHAVRLDEEYTRSNCTYSMSVLPATQSKDTFILDDVYRSQPELVDWLRQMYRHVGIEFSNRIQFAKPKQFAPLVAELLREDSEISAVSTICYSYNLGKTFPCMRQVATSRYLNAKTSLPGLSERYSFSIPETTVSTIAQVREVAEREFNFPHVPVYVKMDGLGGGYNVKKLSNNEDVERKLSEYDPSERCIVQSAVESSYFETIHLYALADSSIEYLGSRIKITAAGQWYGNIFLPNLALNDHQRRTVDAAAHGAWEEGYRGPEPLLIGFDAFINDTELLITEFNARWLGSSPAEYIMRRLGIYNKTAAVSMFDYIAENELSRFTTWIEKNIYRPELKPRQEFSILPMGVCGYRDAGSSRLANFIILGDAHACERDVRRIFSTASFKLLRNSIATLDNIPTKGQLL